MRRQWFSQPKSEVQQLASELLVERRVRREAECQLRAAEQAKRSAEQERDMFRVSCDCNCNHSSFNYVSILSYSILIIMCA